MVKSENDLSPVFGCGVIYVNNLGEILLGLRGDGQGWCLPGGKVDPGETSEIAAARELLEESGLKSHGLTLIGNIKSEAIVHGKMRDTVSDIYELNKFSLTTNSFKVNREMKEFGFFPYRTILLKKLFVPTRASITLYIEYLARKACLANVEEEEV